jgi:hypothetical protein
MPLPKYRKAIGVLRSQYTPSAGDCERVAQGGFSEFFYKGSAFRISGACWIEPWSGTSGVMHRLSKAFSGSFSLLRAP